MNEKNKNIFSVVLKVVPMVLLLVLFGYFIISGKYKDLLINKNKAVNKEVIENILKDIYTPSSMDYFKNRAAYYYENNIMTQEEVESLFTISGNGELTEDDLNRKLTIYKVIYSDINSNSVLSDMYKADCSLKYKDDIISFEIIFELNNNGVIYKHVINEISV